MYSPNLGYISCPSILASGDFWLTRGTRLALESDFPNRVCTTCRAGGSISMTCGIAELRGDAGGTGVALGVEGIVAGVVGVMSLGRGGFAVAAFRAGGAGITGAVVEVASPAGDEFVAVLLGAAGFTAGISAIVDSAFGSADRLFGVMRELSGVAWRSNVGVAAEVEGFRVSSRWICGVSNREIAVPSVSRFASLLSAEFARVGVLEAVVFDFAGIVLRVGAGTLLSTSGLPLSGVRKPTWPSCVDGGAMVIFWRWSVKGAKRFSTAPALKKKMLTRQLDKEQPRARPTW
jgi:hypothetical protein